MMNNLRENNCSVFSTEDPDPRKWRKIAHVEDPLWRGKYPNPFHMVFSLDSKKLYLSVLHPAPAASGIMVVDTDTWTIIKEIQGIGPDLQTPALTYDGKYVLTPFSGFQRLSSGIAVIETATDRLIGILPSTGGHHDCVIIPTETRAYEAHPLVHIVGVAAGRMLTEAPLASGRPRAAESRPAQGAHRAAGGGGGDQLCDRVCRRGDDAQHRGQHGGRLQPAGRRPDGGAGGCTHQHHRRLAHGRADGPDDRRGSARGADRRHRPRRTAARVPHRSIRASAATAESVDLIGFDRERDFTVQPWIAERLGRRMQAGDVIVGAARDLPIGSEIVLFGRPFRIYAKLGRTGVGTHERGIFMTSEDLLGLAPAVRERIGRVPPMLELAGSRGSCIEIAPGATELQVRFALLSRLSGIKVVAGETHVDRRPPGPGGAARWLAGAGRNEFVSTVIMVCVLFSAIVTERRSELGLLKAIGARRGQIVGMMVIEAMIATGVGGSSVSCSACCCCGCSSARWSTI